MEYTFVRFKEYFLHAIVYHQVDVAAAVSQFGVFKPVVCDAVLDFYDGQGRSDLDNTVRVFAWTVISPICVRNTNPVIPTKSPMSKFLEYGVVQFLVFPGADVIA